jgi:predicted PurR-regulated permease PerM
MNAPENISKPAGAQRLDAYARLGAIAAVLASSYLVLAGFVPAILFAAVVCSASWPVNAWLRKRLGGRAWLAALSMCLLLAVLVIVPSLLLAASLSENVMALAEKLKSLRDSGPLPPPEWLDKIPLVGDLARQYWQQTAASGETLATQFKGMLEPARHLLLVSGRAAGEGLLQLVLATFIIYFFYRDGESLMAAIRQAMARLAGRHAPDLLHTIQTNIAGVVNGIFGTALAQGTVAAVGFAIAGIPGALLLGACTLFVSILPIGPPIIWGGATLWLLAQDRGGWAIFMFLWGLLFISTIDNLVKPYLISRSSDLPLLLTVLGVLGGVSAFGFIGLFIGPPLLAVGLALVKQWIGVAEPAPAD